MTRIPSVVLNGDEAQRYIGNLNFSFAYVEGESLLMVRLDSGVVECG
jgi:cysteine desulfurase